MRDPGLTHASIVGGRRLHWRTVGLLLLAIVSVVPLCLRVYHEWVPWGLPYRDSTAFSQYSLQRETGYSGIELWINDAGAMRSGHHTFWLCRRSIWTGLHILYEGRIEYSDEPIQVELLPEGNFRLTFVGADAGHKMIITEP